MDRKFKGNWKSDGDVAFLEEICQSSVFKTSGHTKFHILQKFLADDLLQAKLLFLQSVALELEHYLTDFQSDKPLLPFMFDQLYSVVRSIGNRFLKKSNVVC